MTAPPAASSRVRGFTLVEALVATILMGIVLGALATVTAQWLPNWSRGFVRAQRSELVDVALDRMVADLSAAEFVTASRDIKRPLFDGSELAVMLIRTALGPNHRPGLELVRIGETTDRLGPALVRTRARFAPGLQPELAPFTDPVVLLRAPYRTVFSYAGPDGTWKDTWHEARELPTAVRLVIRDAATDRTLSVSTATLIHVELPAECVAAGASRGCGGTPAPGADNTTPDQPDFGMRSGANRTGG